MTNLTKNKDTLHFDCRDHKLNFQAGKEGMTEPWMNGNLKRQFWMNKIFLDVTNSVVPQTTAEALVSSETPPSRHYSDFVSSHRSSTALNTQQLARQTRHTARITSIENSNTYLFSLCWNFWITVTQFLISSCFWWEWEVNSLWKQPKKQNITVLCLRNIWTKKSAYMANSG